MHMWDIIFFSYFIVFTFTHMCIHCLGHLPLLPGRICSAFLFSVFVEKKTRDNKKGIVFLLVWDKDSYTEVILALLSCAYVLQRTLAHLYQTSSLLPGHLPIVASASLRLLYLLLYSEYIDHIQVLGFLPFPYSSRVHSPLSVWPTSSNITAFVCFRSIICIWGRTCDFWPLEPG
jgi:hypothetical protein